MYIVLYLRVVEAGGKHRDKGVFVHYNQVMRTIDKYHGYEYPAIPTINIIIPRVHKHKKSHEKQNRHEIRQYTESADVDTSIIPACFVFFGSRLVPTLDLFVS